MPFNNPNPTMTYKNPIIIKNSPFILPKKLKLIGELNKVLVSTYLSEVNP